MDCKQRRMVPRARLEETTTELWKKVIQVNLRGTFYVTKHRGAAHAQMRRRSVVNMGIGVRDSRIADLVAYCRRQGAECFR